MPTAQAGKSFWTASGLRHVAAIRQSRAKIIRRFDRAFLISLIDPSVEGGGVLVQAFPILAQTATPIELGQRALYDPVLWDHIAAVSAKSLAGATEIWNGSLQKADVHQSAVTMPHGDTIL